MAMQQQQVTEVQLLASATCTSDQVALAESSCRLMHRVSPELRNMASKKQRKPSVYDPHMISLGPYHHGKEEFRPAEEIKKRCLERCTKGYERDQRVKLLTDKILSKIDQIRGCYAEHITINNNALARMMLLDGCFIINFMRIHISNKIARDSFNIDGAAASLPFAGRDILVLENQIPFFVLKDLISEMMNWIDPKEIQLEEFLSHLMYLELPHAIPREDQDPPIHIVEACRRMLVEYSAPKPQSDQEGLIIPLSEHKPAPAPAPHILELANDQHQIGMPMQPTGYTDYALNKKATSFHVSCPSVTYLKAKGIHFLPSSSHCFKDIKLESRVLYGSKFKLPVCYVSDVTLVLLSNVIAYEVSPGNMTSSPDFVVLSHTNFMKSLVQTPADVLELQRRKILRTHWHFDQEEVVQLFKRIETFDLPNLSFYQDVMHEVGEHCDNIYRTWTADLIHTKLNSPLTAIPFFVATALLGLTLMQALPL